MPRSFTQYGRDVVTGRDRSVAARVVRGLTAVAEPAYTAVIRGRNLAYDRGWAAAHDLGRPTVSVGNVTTGGTGKTPVVRWLVDRLRAAGRRPAVLMRGYKSTAGDAGDEQLLLQQMLGGDVPVVANPSRVDGAAAVLRTSPDTDLFVLDDAFQHRRARRDVDLVLVSATEPFGYGHVLPRGLLREPLAGLRRATAFLITRCSLVEPARLDEIAAGLRAYHRTAPIFRCDAELDDPPAGPFFAVAGIGDPDAFDAQLRRAGGPRYVGHRWFADHHRYTAADVLQIAAVAGATSIVTTEKDWVKLATLPAAVGLPFVVLAQQLRFADDDGPRLLGLITAALTPGAPGVHPGL